MKRVVLLILILVPFVFGAELTREMPVYATQGDETTVALKVTNIVPDSRVVIGEAIPEGAELLSWDIEGAKETVEDIVFDQGDGQLIWEFTSTGEEIVVKYTISLPESSEAVFDAVFAVAPDVAGTSRWVITLLPRPVPAAPLISEPVTESAVPVPENPVQTPDSRNVPLGIAVVIVVGCLMVLYLRTRFAQYHPKHVSFVNHLTAKITSNFQHVTPRESLILEQAAEQQRGMIAQIDTFERSETEPARIKTLEELKRELLSIRFAYGN